jgi:hypothetical protein
MVHVYDVVLQGRRFRAVKKEVLGLGLIMVHVYYDFALQGRRLGVVTRGY